MKKGVKSQLVVGSIIIIVLAILLWPSAPKPVTDIEVAKCIGEKSTLYVQLGCSHCIEQEEMFGDNFQYLNTIDCFYESEKCAEVTGTPMWKIGMRKISGVQTIEQLRALTNC
ncbi:MAG: hypothetical protein PF542_02565 [Nanoarchaeota archaeon]|jgi:hypothetical protein|nr:hypothetical protein [Nanoarchaeota archaeon]